MSDNGQPKTADIVILGAGVMGSAIAFHLAKRKAGRIIVIEKDHVASGGSGRSSALVRMHYSHPPEVQLALVSLNIFENWREVVGEEGEFRRTGFVRIVHPHETHRLKQNVEMQRALGAHVELIDRNQLHELEPDWKVDEVELAAYEPGSGYGDGNVVAADFLSRAREMGVEYMPRTRATGFAVATRARHAVTIRSTSLKRASMSSVSLYLSTCYPVGSLRDAEPGESTKLHPHRQENGRFICT